MTAATTRSTLTMPDGTRLAVRTTAPAMSETGTGDIAHLGAPAPRGIVHVLHGMAEHAQRYDRFADELARAGYIVVVNDQRGHGETSPDSLGHLADHDGWQLLVEDALRVGAAARERYPGLPYVVLGHSMGALVARTLVLDHSATVDALVLVGAPAVPGLLRRYGGLALARLLSRLRGGRRPSPLLDRMTFGAFNAPFEGRTRFDWLSRDPEVVDAYVADPRCGFVCSHRFFVDLLTGLGIVGERRRAAGIRPDLPVYVIAGDQDPVGDFGRVVSDVATAYRRVGVRDVTTRLYPGARHEILAETNREEVVADLLHWLDRHAVRAQAAPLARVIPLRRRARS
ncbi:alpha/beta hydrolase [Mobilicoccus massiliensis]|uniref:alpha/beta hydrolase n=1 Tax=Mobilicoccus massiliensis TaxID=1522310 RepID=UPI00069415EA|nr:alpha/beta hydrolase [Mobilicoccus massiliensis]